MKKLFVLVCTLMFSLWSGSSFGAGDFPWPMFLPAITGHHECSLDNIGLCTDKASCEGVDAYWYESRCNEAKSTNQVFIEKLAGSWDFYYTVISTTYFEHYTFDINTVREYPEGSGEFIIKGVDSYGNTVTGEKWTWLTRGTYYGFINYGFPTIDEWFRFKMPVDSTVDALGDFCFTSKGHNFNGEPDYDLWGYRK